MLWGYFFAAPDTPRAYYIGELTNWRRQPPATTHAATGAPARFGSFCERDNRLLMQFHVLEFDPVTLTRTSSQKCLSEAGTVWSRAAAFFVCGVRIICVRHQRPALHLLLSACGVNFYTFMAALARKTRTLRLFRIFGWTSDLLHHKSIKCRSVSVLADCKNVRQIVIALK